ncbi:MAG: rhodanese-like domain-containing protein [Gammaproteobacteria bacterium]|nr:rhodanese-like domain-containing protein [Gammaproteobacteria bacterium]
MKNNVSTVNPEFVHEKMQVGLPVHLVDVRSTKEFASEHAEGAKSVSMSELSANTLQNKFGAAIGSEEPLYLICTAGFRAQQAAEKLHDQGLNNLYVVNGGTDAWVKSDLPTMKLINKSWSVNLSPQAQAQVFMGILIFLFAVKGVLLDPVFTVLVGFVGLVMLISAFDQRFCLAKVFSDMPWNKA